jgi:hypothetical protein
MTINLSHFTKEYELDLDMGYPFKTKDGVCQGLWLCKDNEWKDFCVKYNIHKGYQIYKHIVKLDDSKLLEVTTLDQKRNFGKRFIVDKKCKWGKLTALYPGVHFSTSISLDSWCVWDLTQVKSVTVDEGYRFSRHG